jgi:hypothetical protein
MNHFMRKITAYIILFLLPLGQVQAVDTDQQIQKSRAAIKMLADELKSTLQASMKANGPLESIAVCRIEAPQIAEKVSQQNDMSVARTSLRYRNQANKPDAWERSVLEQFEQRKIKGEEVNTLDYSEVTELEGKKVFRYMKAIPTAEVCLSCHGSNIPEPLAARINSLYPDDNATGFSLGDIRGAFTVIQPVGVSD